jgi:hypothetical protein
LKSIERASEFNMNAPRLATGFGQATERIGYLAFDCNDMASNNRLQWTGALKGG